MTNSDLTVYNQENSMSVPNVDGDMIDVEGSYLDYLKPSYEARWRITVGQGGETRLPGSDGKLFLTRNSSQIDPVTQEVKKTAETHLLGETVQVFPVAIDVERVMYDRYDPNAEDSKPLCQSIGGVEPIAQFKDKYSDFCMAFDESRKRFVPKCKFAEWTVDRKTQGRVKPDCQEQYVVGVAVSIPGADGPEMVMATCSFKSASAAVGRTLLAQLHTAHKKGEALYLHPVELKVKDAGQGKFTYTGFIRTDISRDLQADEVLAFMEFEQIWNSGQQTRIEGFGEDDDSGDKQPSARKSDFAEDNEIPF